jgi:hypothetical protein
MGGPKCYRITNYVCKTTQGSLQPLGHQVELGLFVEDIIVGISPVVII